ncbi:MAG: hypothetical protein SOV71_00135 [Anaerovoracaceae bacterium]|nr:O-sialoglycoprotein endopeptidase [Bacillota bacterium]MDY2669955.1 hypothetical protein [Anaerovoracaceae bacterium]
MPGNSRAVLAFDTSAYTSSAAVVDEAGRTCADERTRLSVEKGERGLRQSQALFQHINNIPEIAERACAQAHEAGLEIAAVAASSRPRPVEGSYMPVFLAGLNTGRSIASALGVPFYEFSHQEGHVAAAAGILPDDSRSAAFHLSGGTGEILVLLGGMPVKVAGGTLDISFGQLVDRTGVALGCGFPAGPEMDAAAMRGSADLKWHFSNRGRRVYDDPVLAPIHVEGSRANLSGIETSCAKAAASGIPPEALAAELFMRMSDAVAGMTTAACREEGISSVILCGGVASSSFLRRELTERLDHFGIKAVFGEKALSSDNAVGTARLGMAALKKSGR